MTVHAGIVYALAAAALFGASTPFAKLLLGQMAPLLLSALLYLGSGMGLAGWLLLRRWLSNAGGGDAGLGRADWPWLAGAIIFGGIAGPVLLLTGLAATPAASASLLLNMEGVLTAVIAWCVFKENADRRIVLGMALIVAGGAVLGWQGSLQASGWSGPLAIVGACLCWAIDNNLTRRIAASDAAQIACLKGLAAGAVNAVIALALGLHWPAPAAWLAAGLIGFAGYGLSLLLFVLALRQLGTARTGAYFSLAPFVGAVIALALPGETASAAMLIAGLLMAGGLYLHLSERHEHQHEHGPQQHAHRHHHDAHHQHEHDFAWDASLPHSHPHRHAPLRHSHPHFPDIHHRHRH